jgi:hypothetical protein
MTILTPLPSIRSSRAAKPGRISIGSRAAHSGIVEFIDQDESSPLGIALNGGPLSLVAVLVGTDICGR